MNFWTVSYFLYISLTLFPPTHTILAAHNFFAIFIPPSNLTVFPPACQRYNSHTLFCSTGHVEFIFSPILLVCLFLEWQRSSPVHSTWCTHRCSRASLLLSAPLPCPGPSCPCASPTFHTDLPPSFHHLLLWPLHLSGVRVSPHVKQHSRSTEGQGRALLQKSGAVWDAGPIRARGYSSSRPASGQRQQWGVHRAGRCQSACASRELCAWEGFTTPRRLQHAGCSTWRCRS